ncbi:hypothetical protein FH5_04436 [Priestia endophytica]|jgi:hypothetical protein|nr:hypothetical protein FH5_04436 [Priestia endophytica]
MLFIEHGAEFKKSAGQYARRGRTSPLEKSENSIIKNKSS